MLQMLSVCGCAGQTSLFYPRLFETSNTGEIFLIGFCSGLYFFFPVSKEFRIVSSWRALFFENVVLGRGSCGACLECLGR